MGEGHTRERESDAPQRFNVDLWSSRALGGLRTLPPPVMNICEQTKQDGAGATDAVDGPESSGVEHATTIPIHLYSIHCFDNYFVEYQIIHTKANALICILT